MLLKDLAPLTKTPAELYLAPYAEVRKLVPEDTFDPSEEEMIKNFDSRKTRPHLIFLGLDESRKDGGFAWKIYQGRPFFALDVTPRGSEDQQADANGIISAMEANGLSFFQSRVIMSFSAEEGEFSSLPPSNNPPAAIWDGSRLTDQPLSTHNPEPSWTGTSATRFAEPAATQPYP